MPITWSPVTGQELAADIVASPAPTAPRFSLLSVASKMPSAVQFGDLNAPDATEDGLPVPNGVRLDHSRRVQSATFENCPVDNTVKKSLYTSDTTYAFHPWTWYTSITCFGGDASKWREYGDQDIRAAAAWHLGHQVQSAPANFGTVTESPSLNSSAILNSGATVAEANVRDAVALLLQDYFTDNHAGGGAILHLPYAALPQAMYEQIVHETPSGLVGPGGVAVSVGPGYAVGVGSGPVGTTTAATAAWIYLSGPVYAKVGVPFEAADPHGIIQGMIEGRHIPNQNRDAVIVEQRGIFAFDVTNVYARKVVIPS